MCLFVSNVVEKSVYLEQIGYVAEAAYTSMEVRRSVATPRASSKARWNDEFLLYLCPKLCKRKVEVVAPYRVCTS